MKKIAIVLAGVVLLAAGTATASVILVGWENGTTASITNANIGYAQTASGGGNDVTWGSTDGTFGDNTAFSASTSATAIKIKPGTTNNLNRVFQFAITNNSSQTITLESLSLDYNTRNTSAATNLVAYYVSGDLAGVSGYTFLGGITNVPIVDALSPNYTGLDITLASVLADVDLGAGEVAVFELIADNNGVGGGNTAGVLDNVALIGSIPEPATIGTMMIVGGGLLFYRRRMRVS